MEGERIISLVSVNYFFQMTRFCFWSLMILCWTVKVDQRGIAFKKFGTALRILKFTLEIKE